MAAEPQAPAPVVLQFDPEALNRYVADEILKSTLGDKLRKAIDAVLETANNARAWTDPGNPWEKIVREEVRQIVARSIHGEHKERIEQALRAALEGDVISRLVAKAVEDLQVRFTGERF